MTFLERLAAGPPILTDGGTGTERKRLGCGAAEVHAAFVAAGAEVIVADSITSAGLAVTDVSRAFAALCDAIAIARASGAAFVAASLGPSGPAVRDATHRREIYDALAEAAKLSGADVIFAETLLTFFDADAALAAGRAAGLPVAVTFAFGSDGRGYAGLNVEKTFVWANAERPDASGFNCGDGPEPTLDAFERWVGGYDPATGLTATFGDSQRRHGELVRIPAVFRPAAGAPGATPVDPATFAAIGMRAKALGARIIGGCCGAQPAHIAALRDSLRRDG